MSGYDLLMHAEERAHRKRLDRIEEQKVKLQEEKLILIEERSLMQNVLHETQDKFEIVREGALDLKENCEELTAALELLPIRLEEEAERFSALKDTSLATVKGAREEIEETRLQENALISTLLDEIKQFRIENDTLQAELERKIEDNAEITRICDEMLAKEATKIKS